VVPLNLVLSAVFVWRGRRSVDVQLLFTRIVPAMLVGLPFGLVAFRFVPAAWLARAFAVFVLVLGVVELRRELRSEDNAASRPLSRAVSLSLLFVGGVIHGAFATGGPMAVYVAGRTLGGDKARFRATLSTLWLVLNAVVAAGYVIMKRIDRTSARETALLFVPLLIGIAVGEMAHRRVPMRLFRRGVFTLLALAGVVLLLRA